MTPPTTDPNDNYPQLDAEIAGDDNYPQLDAAIVGDDQRLWQILDEMIVKMPAYRKRRRKIIREQKKLKALIDHEAWQQFLVIEAMVNDRNQAVVTAAVKWAFSEGVMNGKQPR